MSQSLDNLKASVVKLSNQVDATLSQSGSGAATDADLNAVAGVLDSLTAKLAAGPVTEPAPPPAA